MRKITKLLVAGLAVAGMAVSPVQTHFNNVGTNIAQAKEKDALCYEQSDGYIVDGNKVYYTKWKTSKDVTTIYRCDTKGENNKKVNMFSKHLTIGAIYNNKMYLCAGTELDGFTTYVSADKGKGKLIKEQKNLNIYDYYKQYMVGTSQEPTDVGPRKLCVYNAKTKKKKSLGLGYAITIKDKKIYYASYNEKSRNCAVVRCSLNGKSKTVLKKFPEKDVVVYQLDKHEACYYSIDADSNVQEKKLKY